MPQISSCPSCSSLRVIRNGLSNQLKCLHGERRQRFQCIDCGKRFSSSTLSLLYRLRKPDLALNAKIFHLHSRGFSNADIASVHHISEHCVRLRLIRLSQRSLVFQFSMLEQVTIREAMAYDGLQNFAGSQFDPNYINQALGKESLFIYSFNFCGLNRSGRSSPQQKLQNSKIEVLKGRYNPKSIRQATAEILAELYPRKEPGKPMHLVTDRHRQYKEAIRLDLAHLKIEQATISSHDTRNYQNHLFAVNHADLLIRQRSKAFARETISFSKTPGAMCQKYSLFMIRKNYMMPQFTKRHVRRPNAHKQSPAQAIGLTTKTLGYDDIFNQRATKANIDKLPPSWKSFWRGEIPPAFQRQSQFQK